MKKIKFFACCLSLVLLAGAWSLSAAAESEPVARAVFSGTGTVPAPADSATIVFELLSVGTTQARLQKESQKSAELLRAALQADFGEDPVLSELGYRTEEGFSGTRFLGKRTMLLSTEHPERAEALREYLISHGVSSVFDITYTCSDPAPYREEALRLAVDDAKAKAAALGLSLPIAEIRDLGCYTCSFGDPLAPQATALTVVCNVELRFGNRE